jgi:Zn finger protein HypA/HybF involved in hydrogenase expression
MVKEIDRIPIIHNGTLYTQPIITGKIEDFPELAKCLRCKHLWIRRTPKPKRCPKCKSPYWNKPRRKPKP